MEGLEEIDCILLTTSWCFPVYGKLDYVVFGRSFLQILKSWRTPRLMYFTFVPFHIIILNYQKIFFCLTLIPSKTGPMASLCMCRHAIPQVIRRLEFSGPFLSHKLVHKWKQTNKIVKTGKRFADDRMIAQQLSLLGLTYSPQQTRETFPLLLVRFRSLPQ